MESMTRWILLDATMIMDLRANLVRPLRSAQKISSGQTVYKVALAGENESKSASTAKSGAGKRIDAFQSLN